MKTWQKNLFTVVGVILAMYVMVFVRVKMESAREFRDAEQYYAWWKHPEDKRTAMLAALAKRPKPKEVAFTKSDRMERLRHLVDMQREKAPMQKQQALKRELAEYYFIHADDLKVDVAELPQADQAQRDSLARDLGDLFEMNAEVEQFKREMTYYYFTHPQSLKPDLEKLKGAGTVNSTEFQWLSRELSDIKEVFESDIKTAFYGYSTVLDIWLDPPGWPPSVLRNSELSRKTRDLIGSRDEREAARLSGQSQYAITQEFEHWVREAAPPPAQESKRAPGKASSKKPQ